ncbi:MAG: hypothetical protein A3F54_05705 [Candidatus Kerfeldbacteria bacterium RIFCSPHIGHO2_12_FULL_48_17]|uniref:Uncharacterized protein n=1 Tax=Candidatus Kerfeldbacteria bacterium RIFCSPHIGHO2_12_FULL_48_17 TaxID=1798542 RepID=A0A1G2B5W0_9BACT|nr:MAG: hypothetical protein A3F54_05705 [Candidatus Kerfeldbacteria bacterium RIFCSPHIGHO2_12_FULL_48_17]
MDFTLLTIVLFVLLLGGWAFILLSGKLQEKTVHTLMICTILIGGPTMIVFSILSAGQERIEKYKAAHPRSVFVQDRENSGQIYELVPPVVPLPMP